MGFLFFRNPRLPQISTFSLGQKDVLIVGKVLIMSLLIMSGHIIAITFFTDIIKKSLGISFLHRK